MQAKTGLILSYPDGKREEAEKILADIKAGLDIVVPDHFRIRVWNGKELRNAKAIVLESE